MNITPSTFEEAMPVIDHELAKRRYKWTLFAVNDMDYDDVSQIIRLHVYNKFNQYDQKQHFAHWLNRIISNQMRNLLRNRYYCFERPCLRCASNQGKELCSLTMSGKQCAQCPLYARWVKRKKNERDVKLTLPLANHAQEVSEKPCDFIDLERGASQLTLRLKEILRPVEWKVYQLLFIENKTENEVAYIMEYTTSEASRSPGYQRLNSIRKKIIQTSKDILKKGLD